MILLDWALDDSSLTAAKRSDALVQRAEVRAKLGKFAEAHADATSALALTGGDSALKAGVEMKLLRLESDHPGYAAHLKTQSGK